MDMSPLKKLVSEYRELDSELLQRKASLARTEEALKDLVENRLPELMDDEGIAEHVTADLGERNFKLTLKRTIRANIPAKMPQEDKARAFKWLRENGLGALIENTFTIIPETDIEEAVLEDTLAGASVEWQKQPKVNAGKLSASVREMLAAGQKVDEKLLNVFDQRVAVVKEIKGNG